jgi:hypothetical protein
VALAAADGEASVDWSELQPLATRTVASSALDVIARCRVRIFGNVPSGFRGSGSPEVVLELPHERRYRIVPHDQRGGNATG